ncbi:TRAP transporter small permease subunit [Aliiroseovarius sp. PTFE2010]|uniref:TRAP transporter small permease subunit n=1 Tax=Aliiroseovarius sp. PTFE2010 TaxID=3417190 RepID=UPI003CF8CBE8
MSHSPVLSDDSAVSRVDRALLRLEEFMNLLAGITIFALVALAVVHVLSRKFFNAPVPGYVDWTQQFMVLFAFLGLAYCQREGGHIRMDIVIGRLKHRPLWIAEFLSILIMLIITTALIYGTYFHFERSFDVTKPLWSSDSSIDIALPLWPAKLVVTISMVVLWLRLWVQLWGFGRAIRRNDDRPVAVPIVMGAAEQAMAEAEGVESGNG